MQEINVRDCKSSLLKSFDCGQPGLNKYLSSYAKQNEEIGYGRTFVLLEEEAIVGYYTLATAQISFEEMPENLTKRLPHYPAPAIRIARLAVSKDKQSQGYGSQLLKTAFKRILLASISAGIAFVLVDAKESAVGFYKRFGFIQIPNTENTFILPIATIMQAAIGQ